VSQSTAVRRRPALVTFAAILVFMLGGFELLVAITEFFKYAFGALPPDTDYSILLGILDGVYALVLLYAGYALLQGHAFNALLVSLTAIHGRTFFEQFAFTAQGWVAAVESIIGIVIEGMFVAMLIQRFFGR
jgi:hypothetical protein